MNSRERVLAAVRGEAVDRVPFAVWRHFYPEEVEPRSLADATIAFAQRFELDVVKYNPRAHYHAEPWGTRYAYRGSEKPSLVRYAVGSPEDWSRIDVRGTGEAVFQELLLGMRLVREALPHVPIVATIFTPLAVLERLAGVERVLMDLRERPEPVLAALDAVAETFRALAAACCEIADGIFLATTQWARRDVLTDDEYARFGRPYDLRVLSGAAGAPLNVLHVCGEASRAIELARSYPGVAAVSWNVYGRGNPGLDAFLAAVPGHAAVGGVSDGALLEQSGDAAAEVRLGLRLTRGRRWICAGGCTIPIDSRPEAIEAARAGLRPTADH